MAFGDPTAFSSGFSAGSNAIYQQGMLQLAQQREQNDQQNKKRSEFLDLRTQAVDFLGHTIEQFKIAHPGVSDIELMSNPAIKGQVERLSGFDKNLGLSPDDAQSIAAGFIARPSAAVTEGALARAKASATGELGRTQAQTEHLTAETAAIKSETAQFAPTAASPNNPDGPGGPNGPGLGDNTSAMDPADKWLSQFPPNVQEGVRSTYGYETSPQTTYPSRQLKGMGTSVRAKMIELTEQYGQLKAQSGTGEPYDQTQFPARNKVVQAFANKSPNQPGGRLQSLNAFSGHMDTFREAVNALDTGDYTLLNRIRNNFELQTGTPMPNDVQGIARVLGDELTRYMIGGPGAIQDRESLSKVTDPALAKKTILSMANKYDDLVARQAASFRYTYEAGTSRKDFETKFLMPSTRKKLKSNKSYTEDFDNQGGASGGKSGDDSASGGFSGSVGDVKFSIGK